MARGLRINHALAAIMRFTADTLSLGGGLRKYLGHRSDSASVESAARRERQQKWNSHSTTREYSTVPFFGQTINLLISWRPGVELNHRHPDFQSDNGGSRGLLISHLQRLPPLSPRLTTAHLRRTQSELDTFLAQQRLTAFSPRLCRFPRRKAACHTCARFYVHPSPHDARRLRHPRQSSGTELSWFVSLPSQILLQELRRRT
jgi:hypothetical protein